ncbi:hypothetical protein AZE42_09916 [Rhizopogon vesiculosus]|uniref:Uncharacterized protein n=1 Tax=Rhizopogon vesiculosus TaxID=180088 RepID=A0A1J8R596_9AGAM|nr:hypothetical protein AZE42_09916 [Rhizopogon vesiculosus]
MPLSASHWNEGRGYNTRTKNYESWETWCRPNNEGAYIV